MRYTIYKAIGASSRLFFSHVIFFVSVARLRSVAGATGLVSKCRSSGVTDDLTAKPTATAIDAT